MSGTFELQRVIAAGTYGTVCVATDTDTGRTVALKVLHQRYVDNEEATRRARDEALLLSRLRHPCVVEGYGLRRIDGRPVAVLEYVEGASLEGVYNASSRLELAEVVEIMRRMGSAVDAGYSAPVGPKGRPLRAVHGDLKPANVLLTIDGVLKIIDYGSAQSSLSGAVRSEGSAGYLAPERLRDTGRGIDISCDIYAIGATGYALMTGEHLPAFADVDQHHDSVAKALRGLSGAGPVAGLRHLILAACAHHADARPRPDELVDRLLTLQRDHDLSDDLADLGGRGVPLVSTGLDDEMDEIWIEVAFLQNLGSDIETAPLRPYRELRLSDYTDGDTQRIGRRDRARLSGESDELVRRFMEQSDWHERLGDLQKLLNSSSGWSAAPFVDLVQAQASWWRRLAGGPSRDQLVAALRMLVDRAEPEVVAVVEPLCDHSDPHVAAAAEAVVRAAGRRPSILG